MIEVIQPYNQITNNNKNNNHNNKIVKQKQTVKRWQSNNLYTWMIVYFHSWHINIRTSTYRPTFEPANTHWKAHSHARTPARMHTHTHATHPQHREIFTILLSLCSYRVLTDTKMHKPISTLKRICPELFVDIVYINTHTQMNSQSGEFWFIVHCLFIKPF